MAISRTITISCFCWSLPLTVNCLTRSFIVMPPSGTKGLNSAAVAGNSRLRGPERALAGAGAGEPARLGKRDGPGLPVGDRGDVSLSLLGPPPSVSLPEPAAKERLVDGAGRPPFIEGAGEPLLEPPPAANLDKGFLSFTFFRAAVDSLPLASDKFGEPGRLRFCASLCMGSGCLPGRCPGVLLREPGSDFICFAEVAAAVSLASSSFRILSFSASAALSVSSSCKVCQ